LKPSPCLAAELNIRPSYRARDFSEQVRDLFNDRAEVWGRNYKPDGKLTWRLHQFCSVLGGFVAPPAEVLDFGCGTGHLAKHLGERHYVVTACDVADQMIMKARQVFGDADIKWKTLPANWRQLPFVDRSFDAVVASSVMEYVGDLELAFRELARVLREGGVLIFNAPNPRNGRRKREEWAKRMTRRAWIRRMVCTIPRIRRYLTYLSLSSNRFPLGEWESGAGRHGFQRVHAAHRSTKRPLFLFMFQKVHVAQELRNCTSDTSGHSQNVMELSKHILAARLVHSVYPKPCCFAQVTVENGHMATGVYQPPASIAASPGTLDVYQPPAPFAARSWKDTG
jgi:ubiquinone/menaquinone biosynthesis C-methylase UbiE